MKRSYRFLLRPTTKQVQVLIGTLAIHCEVYNAALQHRRDAWRKARTSVNYFTQCAELTEVRQVRPDVAAVSVRGLRETLRNLDFAFAGFFRRVKAGETPGYPRFRATTRFDTITFPYQPALGDARNGRIHLPKIGWVRMHQHRPLPEGAQVRQVKVTRLGRRWFVVLLCDKVPAREYPTPVAGRVGVDLGITALATTSDGRQYGNPRHLAVAADGIAEAQRRLAQCSRRSNRRTKRAAALGALYAKVRRQRLDTAHKVALDLTQRHDVIVHEALQVDNMTRRPAPRPDGAGAYLPNGAAAKAGLNRSILDAGWGVLLRCLAEKAEEAARTIIAVDPRHTSQRCHECGHVAAGNRVSQAVFRCQACGHEAHADVNAAKNVLRAGLVLREASWMPSEKPPAGGGVTPPVVLRATPPGVLANVLAKPKTAVGGDANMLPAAVTP